MLGRLFPKQIDNGYRGLTIAIWLLAPVVLLKLVMGFNVAGLNPWVSSAFVLQNADGIPLDSYSAHAARTAVFMFASWGLALFVLSAFALVALIRYRGMLPLVCLLLATEQIGRMFISASHPIARAAATGPIPFATLINWSLAALLIAALILSLIPRRRGE